MSFETDVEIAKKQQLQPIAQIAAQIGLDDNDLLKYGDYMAKVKMDSIQKILASKDTDAPLILVTAMSPTAAGEGKTTVSIGLAQAMNLLGAKTTVAIREPSMGPCFGRKGGAAGGGYSQVLPMENINLHFTGDFHAITSANNLIAAMLDNHIYFGNVKRLSPHHIFWRRVIDMNDRALRDIITGFPGNVRSPLRETGFDITPASAIQAVLCLSTSYKELKERIGNILLGFDQKGKPVIAKDLNVQGAATAILKEALMPNLVQTTENTPAFVHGGPFANIAQGTNSIMATKLAMKLSDYVITEAGFGTDLGAEKFVNIVGRYGNFMPSCVVLVATVRSLKMHGGVNKEDLNNPSASAIRKGACNLEKHIENIRKLGLEPIIAINQFPSDSIEELEEVEKICKENGVESAIVNYRNKGGKGGINLAEKVVQFIKTTKHKAKPVYKLSDSVENKILKIAKEFYGAKDVSYALDAQDNLRMIKEYRYDNLPICMAKTEKSFSDDPTLLGRPRDFTLTIREIIVSTGAGFLIPLTGNIMRMPGLPKVAAAEHIDIDDDGNITGLF